MTKPYTATIYLSVCGVLILLGASVDSLSGATGDKGVRLKSAGTVSLRGGYYIMSDGGGYRWDVQYCGNVYKGQDYAYTGAMYCQVNGSNIRSMNFIAQRNSSGDEIEIGPCFSGGLNCWRRIKVYKDRPLARWLDIFTNPSSKPITVSVSIYSNMRYGIQKTTTSSGGKVFGKKDWAFYSTHGRVSAPATLHVVSSPHVKLRPTVEVSSSMIRVNYSLTVPAKQTVMLCHFESQNRKTKDLASLMKNFPLTTLLGDIPGSARAKILNMRSTGTLGYVDLMRSYDNDTVILTNGDPIYGVIESTSFSVSALSGRIDLPPDRITGMAASKSGGFRAAMIGGEILAGPISGDRGAAPAVTIRLRSGSRLTIPLARIRQWSYRLSESRPDEDTVGDVFVVSTKGDKLRLSGDPVTLKFRTRHGVVSLDSKYLISIEPADPKKKPSSRAATTRPGGSLRMTRRAVLKNGSELSGSFADKSIKLKLHDGREISPDSGLLAGLYFSEEIEPAALASSVELIDGDKLFGRLTAGAFRVVTKYGRVEIGRTELRTARFKPGQPDGTSFLLRNSTVLSGRLADVSLEIEIAPSTKLKLETGLLSVVDCPMPLPVEAMVKRIELLIAQLGSESIIDRESAIGRLAELGTAAAPVLRRYLKTGDPVVREGVWKVLIKLGADR
ncbi:MAG: HEAT repeat domain-containing protein [Phycisphaerae bacterium]|jgi:hypothetical protein|nr:HEAT repeat domain-containing protein [Phycisphaerae bacterium]